MSLRALTTRRALCVVAVVAPLGWVATERLRGPRTAPLPGHLPAITRAVPTHSGPFPAPGLTNTPGTAVNPGESIRSLHQRGLRGQGTGIAIIDGVLLPNHREYAARLRWYDEIDVEPSEPARWHATAVASIAAGETLGAAPEADLYFVGLGMNWAREPLGPWWPALRRAAHSGQPQALAIRRILEINRRLAPDRKIRVISMSIGRGPLDAVNDALREARREGILIANEELRARPLGPVVIASPADPDAYLRHTIPAGSWAIAWWAGRYALACQEDPTMTPEKFLPQVR